MMTDTIYALATAKGQAGVAVIRVSGPQALESFKSLTRVSDISYRHAILCKLKRPVSRETLDTALVIPFQAPDSYTGENVVEYHVHGGAAVIRDVLNALDEEPDHRMAQPGEFTRRAFENGKLDLTEAEAVADLIHAETTLQKRQALSQMNGGLKTIYDNWRVELTKILAYVEAELEFPDEDMPDNITETIHPKVETLANSINVHLDDNRRGERLRDGIRVAVMGAPNAGKSSLINTLVQRDIAIVSPIAGTTRDVIEAHLDIGGYPVILSDTAGLRANLIDENDQDLIEQQGIERAFRAGEEADIRVVVYDGQAETLDHYSLELERDNATMTVINKIDKQLKLPYPDKDKAYMVSVKTEEGLDVFLGALKNKIEQLIGSADVPSLTRARHRSSLVECQNALSRSLMVELPELTAEDIRLAIRHLGEITGKVDVEDILDVVFKDFCIGK